MSDRALLISSDCHGGPRPVDYRPYLETQYHEELDRYLADTPPIPAPANRPGLHDRDHRVTFGTQLETRLADLESEGIVGEVIFPDGSAGNAIPFTGMFGGTGRYRVELQTAALRAYNRWLGEHCAPNRQIGLALIPMHDPVMALAEVKRARSLGLSAIYPEFDGADSSAPPLYDERFDPLWAACVDDRLTVSFHGGCGIPTCLYDSKTGRHVFGQEIQFWSRRPLWHFILGGILERFPDLRVGLTEIHSDWIPGALLRMERQWDPPANATHAVLDGYSGASLREICPLPPSEYWKRQCFAGASALSRREVELRHSIGVESMLFGTDHPHSAASWGCTIQYLQLTFGAAGVPEHEARAMLGENMAKFYDIDLKALEPIVERVGPRIEDILTVPGPETLASIPEYMRPRVQANVDRLPD